MYHITRNLRTTWGVHLRSNVSICTLSCLNVKYDSLNRRQKDIIYGKSHWRTISNLGHGIYVLSNGYTNPNSDTISNILSNTSAVGFRNPFHTCAYLCSDDVKEKLNIDLDDKSKVEEYVEHQREKLERRRKLLAAREKIHDAYIFKPIPGLPTTPEEQIPPPTAVAVKKKPLHTRIMKELNHYYKGFKLLYLDTKIAARLLWNIMNGKTLSRREKKQFLRTVADLFRLVPFMVFLIIPFMEFLLPVAIKLFPGMLPSTFEDKKSREDKRRLNAKLRLKMAEFLQDTIEEISVSSEQKGDKANPKLKQFAKFVNKTRTEGDPPSNQDIMKYSKYFEDEITLDNIPYDQLKALCLIMMISPIGTGNFLRFKIRLKLQELKADDQMIRLEGVNTLSSEELQTACAARGMRALGVTVDRMKENLHQWLELSLDHQIPASLLLLSRTLYIQNPNVDEQLKLTISQLPERLIDEMELKIGAVEGEAVDRQTIIDIIKHEEEQIKSEKIERDKEISEEEKRKQKEMLEPIIAREEQLSKEDLLKVKDSLSVSEKQKLDEIKGERKEYIEDVEELKLVPKVAVESVASTRLGKRIDAILKKVDKSLKKLDDGLAPFKIDEDEDGIVTTHELSEAIRKLSNAPDEVKTQRLIEIVDQDKDGVIDLNEMRIAVKLFANEDLTDLNQEQIQEVLSLIRKSEKVFLLEQLLNKRKSNYLIGLVPAAGKKANES